MKLIIFIKCLRKLWKCIVYQMLYLFLKLFWFFFWKIQQLKMLVNNECEIKYEWDNISYNIDNKELYNFFKIWKCIK